MAANERHKREMNRRKAPCAGMTVKLTEGLVNGPDPKCVREFNGSLTVYASFVLQPQTGLKSTPHIFKIGIVASSERTNIYWTFLIHLSIALNANH